jgi:hypothetical protein
MWERGERNQVLDGRRRRCRMSYEERETIEHMWNGYRKKILNEDGREIRWMKEIWKRREG